MKNVITSYIGWLLILSALGFYLYGIGHAIDLSWNDEDIKENIYPEVLNSTIGTIQALLMTNLGVVLGISIAKPQSAIAQIALFQKQAHGTTTQVLPAPLDIREKVQLFAVVLYILSLIACLIVWIRNDFSSDAKHVISVIPQSGQMFIGVILAYLTAVFGKSS